ncbi:Gmad2 immunoglobulin-like domain-containing protein [Virgibacillus necropolis]|uniref:Gmad2 immunoglobulin-like domain-containing protein n=1 Tax=Virgibacillus necropolis TaxID=163877 RepID=UPI00384D4346
MKKFLLLMIITLLFAALVACSNDNEEENKNKNQEEQQEKEEQKVYENESFKDVTVNESGNQFVVTGKARVFEGVFQYAIINKSEIVKQDNYHTEGAPTWGEFEIAFDKELATTIELFFFSAKDGSKTDVLKIPLDMGFN